MINHIEVYEGDSVNIFLNKDFDALGLDDLTSMVKFKVATLTIEDAGFVVTLNM